MLSFGYVEPRMQQLVSYQGFGFQRSSHAEPPLAMPAEIYNSLPVYTPQGLEQYAFSKHKFKNPRVITEEFLPDIVEATRKMAVKGHLPVPLLILVQSRYPNAAAMSTQKIIITDKMLAMATPEELCAVIGHELAHVKKSTHHAMMQTVVPAVAGWLAAAGAFIASLSIFKKIWPKGERNVFQKTIAIAAHGCSAGAARFLARLATKKLTVPPTEYEADQLGSVISGDPGSLADGLKKLDDTQQKILETKTPLVRGINTLINTYPPTQSRVARLRQMEAGTNAGMIR